MRLFTAIELGSDVRAEAGALVSELQRRAQRASPHARITWVSPERMHLTLRFIGEVDAPQGERILSTLRDSIELTPFTVCFGALGAFPGKGPPRVLWVDIEEGGEALIQVEACISRRLAGLGIPGDDRPYAPHLTLARVREPAGLRAPALFEGLTPRLGETRVSAITLFESVLSPKGPAYTVLQQTPLR